MELDGSGFVSCPTPKDILDELDLDSYLPQGPELDSIRNSAESALTNMIQEPTNYREHIEAAKRFLKSLWKKYDCENVQDVFDAFIKVEPVLIDMNEDEGIGFRYRDHSVHTFHVFTFGLRLMSKLIQEVGDKQAKHLLKVEPENIHDHIPVFRDYNFRERLLYLWSLTSTFHDIAVPLQHLGIIRDGLNKFSKHFDLNIAGPRLERDIIATDLNQYFARLSSIFEHEVSLDEQGICYKQKEDNPYVKNILARSFMANDHGVLGGFLMYKTVEKTFLLGKSSKHAFTQMTLFNKYTRYILTQDVARAALAISLHNLRPRAGDKGPLFLPLSFEKYPLAFILILSDGIQEYLRWEGSSTRGGTKIGHFPALQLKKGTSGLELQVIYYLGTEEFQEQFFIKQAKILADMLGDSQPQSSTEAAGILCKALSRELTKQISLDGHFSLWLTVMQGEKELLKSKVGGTS